ncbi:hypothetical protein MTR_7g116260 [Medicago truncatula]|uniref:FBD domain-containing protein n=2 Tax=Medicago truncatula TaxID=3880 RepID=G7L2W3_MEDTR|nr:hypothetical protein MTR_7g116260 [Medicago truncatula]
MKVPASIKITQSFRHLKQLDFIIDWYTLNDNDDDGDECSLLWILNILQASPLLQKLSVMFAHPRFHENQNDIMDVGVFSHNEVKVIEFGGCVGNWFEIEFVMNVIKYAHKLEKIVMTRIGSLIRCGFKVDVKR